MNGQCKLCQSRLLSALHQTPGAHPSLFLSQIPLDPAVSAQDYSLYQCEQCAHLQQNGCWPLDLLKPRFAWQRFREPEQHLDELADTLVSLSKKAKQSSFLGFSWQDTSLLERLERRGLQAKPLDPHRDLGVPEDARPFGIETLQESRSHLSAGNADGLVARDILEHAFDPVSFLQHLGTWLKEDGLLVIEVPGTIELLRDKRYWLLWEHHISHFTLSTLRFALEAAGFSPIWEKNFALDAGEYLVMVARKTSTVRPTLTPSPSSEELVLGKAFSAGFAASLQKVQEQLKGYQTAGRPVYFYGANHVSHWWIQVFRAQNNFAAIIDDATEKQGFYLPGTGLRIENSAFLNEQRNSVCLHLFGPQTEAKVRLKLSAFIEKGGILLDAQSRYASS